MHFKLVEPHCCKVAESVGARCVRGAIEQDKTEIVCVNAGVISTSFLLNSEFCTVLHNL